MANYHKQLGYSGESLVKDDYIGRGYTFLYENFTMRGGEIDLIFVKDQVLVFVEVKVVNAVTQLHGYVTKKKLHYIQKTITYFLLQEGDKYKDFMLRFDVAFVKRGKIYEVYENIWIG